MGGVSVRIAKAMMRLREQEPGTFSERYEAASLGLTPTYVRYHKEAARGGITDEARRANLLERAEERYAGEQIAPYESYFGDIDIAPYLRGKAVLDFGSFTGGMARYVTEKFHPAALTGVDIGTDEVAAAELSFAKLGLPGRFVCYPGDHLPFADEEFDTVYTYDVFQQVADLPLSIRECYRVLRPGGHLLAVVAGFYYPEAHYLHLVTGTPGVHYFFGRETLNRAYEEILDERGERASWYRRSPPGLEPWERTFMHNGITKRALRSMAKDAGFVIERDHPLALGSTGRRRQRQRLVRLLVPLFGLFARLPLLEEVFSHRIVLILRKPRAPGR
jgi:SAM-dependent methyltransferase